MASPGRPPPSIDALLFDMGGVLVEIDFDRVFRHWAQVSGTPAERIRGRWHMDEAYCRHECGEIGVGDYFESLRASLGIDLTDEQFAAGWHSIFVGEVPGIAPILGSLRGRVPLYVFSNSNPAHQAVWEKRFAAILEPFDRIFVSSDLGRRKPEPAAFHAVCRAIDVPPERVVFFDDSRENVAGALAIGMDAVHVGSTGDIERALAARGL